MKPIYNILYVSCLLLIICISCSNSSNKENNNFVKAIANINLGIDKKTFEWLKGSKVLENLINEDIGQGVLGELTSTGLLSVLDRYMSDIEHLEENQAYLQ